jgi:leader peptidase (prepilin peptidase)/N-methyltransferase
VPVILVGAFGLLIGSFLNVVILRVPAGRSLVAPASACGSCGTPIRPWDNVPVLSWIFLRARCRDCGASISLRYPLVELGTALFFATVAFRFGPGLVGPVGPITALIILPAFLYFASISVALALIDLDTHRLPNSLVRPSYVVGLVLLGAAAVTGNDLGPILRGALGLCILWAAYLVLALAVPGGMGFGDVKLAGVIGLFLGYLGWGELAVGAFAAFLLGGIFALGLLAAKRVNRRSGIPFGPWMLAGAWVGIFFGATVWDGYLNLLGMA